MNALKKLELLAQKNKDGWGNRCVLELQYAAKISESEGGAYDTLVSGAIGIAWNASQSEGTITKATTEAVENALKSIADNAKSYTLICIGHAHIDMNWMWGYDETVSITLDTFRTMLDLLNEYPEYTYAQSQASVYRIVERHCPDMLEEIKRRVHEGRWEVTASTWVEADRNMPNMESMARHFLYTKKYLSKLLDIDPASLDLDYEPDTFGHHVNVPEVLCDAGVKYYYHCRGNDGSPLYNWKAPSGRSILVFREPTWYNWNMDWQCALFVPDFCKKHGINAMLRPYGVGDHGGGPTRRDIEKIIDMNTWPIFPVFKFGTYGEFYRIAEKNRAAYPTIEGELNFIFDGCYTTQTRQKRGNRLGESALAEAEGISALARLAAGAKYGADRFEDAWEKVLFNQFHDILPGSGVTETREYAMGQYQEALTTANTERSQSLRTLSASADTSAFIAEEDVSSTRSEGAGVGYGITANGIAQVGRHAGLRRLFTVYNPQPFTHEETAEIAIWDWNGDISRMRWADASGEALAYQVISNGFNEYWGHLRTDVLVRVKVPAMGYAVIALDEKEPEVVAAALPTDPRTDTPPSRVLENEFFRAELDSRDGSIVSLVDKRTGREYVKPGSPIGVFRLVEESTVRGASSWVVGQYQKIHILNDGVKFKETKTGAIRQSIVYEKGFGNNSLLSVAVSLDKGAAALRFDATVRWQEIGAAETFFPQLNFLMPVNYDYSNFRYDIPMGAIDRKLLNMDVPAQSYGMPMNLEGSSLMLISDSKYGYRGTAEGLSLTLIRSSIDPDPWPEVGEHRIRLGIAMGSGNMASDANLAAAFCRGFLVSSATAHKGILPHTSSLMELSGGIVLSAVKQAESGKGIIVRYYECDGKTGTGRIKFFCKPVHVQTVDLLEQPVEGSARIDGGDSAVFEYKPFSIGNLLVEF